MWVSVCVLTFTLKLVHLCCPFQKITMPEDLYEAVVEVDERVVLEQESCELQLHTSIDTTSIDEKVRGEGRGGG